MHLTKESIQSLDKIKRLNIVNSITGIKPANLIGTISDKGNPNLAIFNSVVHLGSNPALIGFVSRPSDEVRRHTYENILETGFYTINHIHDSFIEKAHYTSAKFEEGISEFEKCQLNESYLHNFKAPFVEESKLKMGLKFVQEISIPLNGTVLIIGEIEHLILPDESLNEKGHINLETLDDVGISGLNSYYKLHKIADFPYARPDDLPKFS